MPVSRVAWVEMIWKARMALRAKVLFFETCVTLHS